MGAAGLILDGCGKPEKLIPLLVSPDEFVPYEEGWVHTVCQTCSAGCGNLVREMQGFLTELGFLNFNYKPTAADRGIATAQKP